MPPAKSPNAYGDISQLFDYVAANGPTAVEFETEKKAKSFQLRIHSARRCMRAHNNLLYPLGHPNHNTFPYDNYEILLRGKVVIVREHSLDGVTLRPATAADIDPVSKTPTIPD